jgi:membrane protein YdbS with pleckstrin-like domain
VTKLDRTYQVAPAGAPATGLEEYAVETASGEAVGKVQTLLEGDDGLLLAVELGTPPLTHEVHVVPWRRVEEVDHEALSVRLTVDSGELERAPELDPDRGVETDEADLRRVETLPAEARGNVPPGNVAGPVDRMVLGPSIALGLLGVFAFLAWVIMVTQVRDLSWHWALLAVPLVLIVASGYLAYDAFRNQAERP